LERSGLAVVRLATIDHEPEVRDVDAATDALLGNGPSDGDLLLALGGGSAIDLAKATAAMATNRRSTTIRDYLEGVGAGLSIENRPLPVVAVPTTAGTGSEATKNAVISCYDPPFKKSLRSAWMVPRIAVVDPELTSYLPPHTTAWTGMDAITQLIESYVSRRATPVTRALALTGLRGALSALKTAVTTGGDRQARQRMAQAALLSGMALANSGLGMAHGVAAALGAHCHTAHGLACAVMLPAAIAANRAVRQSDLATVAQTVLERPFDSPDAAIDRLLQEIRDLYQAIGIPTRLSRLKVVRDQIPLLVRDSRGSSMSGNPRELTDAELTEILEAIW
jgi:alcohol dehydrogenase class IV